MDYNASYQEYLALAQKTLDTLCDQYLPKDSRVCTAARYSLMNGGKRIRAILVLAACDLLDGNCEKASAFAGAIEMLHCYSLIHDDLPCMDNSDYRRGQPSCHKAYDEATALLAGDALLTAAFEVLSDADLPPQAIAQAVKILASAAGGQGMVYGQELDLLYETKRATEEELQLVHRNKTGALINAAVQLGAIAAQAAAADRNALKDYAAGIGLVFQIVDDVLDVTSTEEEMGKPTGSDSENGKTTFATLYGVEGAMEQAKRITDQTCAALAEQYGNQAEFLLTLANSLLERKN